MDSLSSRIVKGLKNYDGTVCYISCLLMSLSSLSQLVDFLLDDRLNGLPNNAECFLLEIRELILALIRNENSDNLYKKLLSKLFTFCRARNGPCIKDVQGDAQEVFIFLKDNFSNSLALHTGQVDFAQDFLAYLTQYSPIIELGHKCKICTHRYATTLPTLMSLHTSANTKDVYDCLYLYSKISKIEYNCQNCKQKSLSSSSSMRLHEFPKNILTFCFQLFNKNNVSFFLVKLLRLQILFYFY